MTIQDINNSFEDLLQPNDLVKQRRRRAIGLSGKAAAWYRWQNKQSRLTIDTKIRWLSKAGIDTGIQLQYSRVDMIEFLHFSRRQDSMRSAATLGDEYLFDKYLIWRQQGKPGVISTGV